MHFILFLMFFITPPALGNDRPWTLQSTQTLEFDSWHACDDFISKHLMPSVLTTDTVSVFGWCTPKDLPPSLEQSKLQDLLQGLTSAKTRVERQQAQQELSTEAVMSKVGSCYSYVPAPVVTDGRRPTQGKSTRQAMGSCVPR